MPKKRDPRVSFILRTAGQLVDEMISKHGEIDGMCSAIMNNSYNTTLCFEAKKWIYDVYQKDSSRTHDPYWFAPPFANKKRRAFALYLGADLWDDPNFNP
jgi:hypothetical protein